MRRILVVGILLLGFAVPAGAQVVTGSTGAINGAVADNTKGVLPGVTVTIQSPQMMGTREAVSDEQGRYGFAAVPPGEYKMTFSLPGFATLVRENIRVNLGFTASVDVEMQVATQQETITVSGESPVVDTTATNVTNNFDAQTIQNLPTARDFPALMAETPGVSVTRIDVGGSAALSEIGFKVYGLNAAGNLNQIATEGILAPTLTNLYNDFGSFQEVQITTAGHTAEMAVPGVMSNTIAKSGGNEFRGTFYTDYEKDEWGSRNIDDAQVKLGVLGGFGLDARDTNRVDKYQDVNGDFGGYAIKDKLWWYGSLRYNASDVRYVNFPVKPQYTRITSKLGKITYNLSPNNKLIAFHGKNVKYQPERFVDKNQIHYSLDEPWFQDFPIGQWKVEYNSVLSQSMFFEVRYGLFFKDFWNYSRAPQKPLYVDTSRQERFGGERANFNNDYRPQMNGSLSYFKSSWGTHNFKLGWEIAKHTKLEQEYGRYTKGHLGEPNPPPDIEYRLVNGVPTEVQFRESPNDANFFQRIYSSYINDQWQLNQHFSFNVGVRFDRYRNGIPEQIHPVGPFNATEDRFPANPDAFHFSELGPRAGVVWDVRGNGKTVVKANYGAYPWRPTISITGQNPNPTQWLRRYVWTDLNNDRLWQPGEEGRLVQETGGITNQRIDPNWKNNVTSEVVAWVEREVFANFGMRTGFVWRGDNNQQLQTNPNRPFEAYNVPVTVPDPGPDGVLGNGDDGPSFTAWNLSPAYLDVPLINMTTHNPYVDGDDYYTWEISGVKRMANNWSLNGSFANTWNRTTPNTTNFNPNNLIGTDSDGRKHFVDWQAKLAGTIRLVHDIKLSPVVRYQSGDPYGRTIVSRLNYGTQTIQVEKESARRVDNVMLTDLRAEKGFTFKGRRVGLFLDLFNIFNANPEQEIVQGSGGSFQRPVVIVGPRVARLGTKFEW